MPARPTTIDDLGLDDYDIIAADRTGAAVLPLLDAGANPFEYMRTPGHNPACHVAVARWVRSKVAAGPSKRLLELFAQAIECDANDRREETPPTYAHFVHLARLIARADRDPSWSRSGSNRRRATLLQDLAIAFRDGAGQVAGDTGRLDVLGLVADFLAASGEEVGDMIAVGVQQRWHAEITAEIMSDPSRAAASYRILPPRKRVGLCRWAATPSASSDAAVAIAVAAAASGAGAAQMAAHMAARIVAAHPEIAGHADLVDVLSEQVRAGDTACAIACCKAGVSPFPFAAGLDESYLADQRAWITSLLADQSPSPAARQRRLLLIHQAAAEAGVLSVAGGRAHHRGTPPTSLHRAATAPHMGGLVPDHEPLIWLASMAIHQGAAMRDKQFAASMAKTAAAHAGLTGDLRVLAALSGTPT